MVHRIYFKKGRFRHSKRLIVYMYLYPILKLYSNSHSHLLYPRIKNNRRFWKTWLCHSGLADSRTVQPRKNTTLDFPPSPPYLNKHFCGSLANTHASLRGFRNLLWRKTLGTRRPSFLFTVSRSTYSLTTCSYPTALKRWDKNSTREKDERWCY